MGNCFRLYGSLCSAGHIIYFNRLEAMH